MRSHRLLLWLYLVFLVTILAQAGWWLIYLGREGEHYLNFQIQRLQTDQLHAAYLLRSVPEFQADPEAALAPHFPDLVFKRTPTGYDIQVDPPGPRRPFAARRRTAGACSFGKAASFSRCCSPVPAWSTSAYRREQAFRRSRTRRRRSRRSPSGPEAWGLDDRGRNLPPHLLRQRPGALLPRSARGAAGTGGADLRRVPRPMP